ncbi:MAG: hypothetical protein AAGL09_10940 [Pseudomonadota bacterium]
MRAFKRGIAIDRQSPDDDERFTFGKVTLQVDFRLGVRGMSEEKQHAHPREGGDPLPKTSERAAPDPRLRGDERIDSHLVPHQHLP